MSLEIHPLVKKVIVKLQLFEHKPKRARNILRSNQIPEVYIPPLQQLSLYLNHQKKKQIDSILKNTKESLYQFILEHNFDNIKLDSDFFILF